MNTGETMVGSYYTEKQINEMVKEANKRTLEHYKQKVRETILKHKIVSGMPDGDIEIIQVNDLLEELEL